MDISHDHVNQTHHGAKHEREEQSAAAQGTTDANAADPIPYKRQHTGDDQEAASASEVTVANLSISEPEHTATKDTHPECPRQPQLDPEIKPAAASTMSPSKPQSTPTIYLYRSCDTTKSYDTFHPTNSPDFPNTLRSSGTAASSPIHSIQAHVVMKWNELQPSPYISLHANRSWAIFNQLEHEYRCSALGRSPRYMSACTPWTLHALEVPLADVREFDGTYPLAHNMARLADSKFGYLQVRVARHAQVVIPSGLRAAAMDWFADQWAAACARAAGTGRPAAPRYPYRQWFAHVMGLDRGREWLEEDVVDPVDMWQAGKTDAEVEAAVTQALAENPIHPSAGVASRVPASSKSLRGRSASSKARQSVTDAEFFGMSEDEYERCKEYLVSRQEIEALWEHGGGHSWCGCAEDHNGACMGPPPFGSC